MNQLSLFGAASKVARDDASDAGEVRLASWNVNGVRARLPHIQQWIRDKKPSILCLQETKVEDGLFPFEVFDELGYHVAVRGQARSNGVAILSKLAPQDVRHELAGVPTEARFLAAQIGRLQVVNVYVPNAPEVEHPSFRAKLDWLGALRRYLDAQRAGAGETIVCGDVNVAPEDRDVDDPRTRMYRPYVAPAARRAFQDVLAVGLVDLFRVHCRDAGQYTWWDYRGAGLQGGRGMRLDVVLGSPSVERATTQCWVDRAPRAWERPSDHAPLVADFAPFFLDA